jgi:large exoprotein involved in heme utilization and adhesion
LTIDGVIHVNGMANLSLIDPQGMVFGENAKLNRGNSFVVRGRGDLPEDPRSMLRGQSVMLDLRLINRANIAQAQKNTQPSSVRNQTLRILVKAKGGTINAIGKVELVGYSRSARSFLDGYNSSECATSNSY